MKAKSNRQSTKSKKEQTSEAKAKGRKSATEEMNDKLPRSKDIRKSHKDQSRKSAKSSKAAESMSADEM